MRSNSWLLPDGADRERMVELDAQLQPVRRLVFAVLGVSLVASGPWLGWWTLLPLAFAIVGFRVADGTWAACADRNMRSSPRGLPPS